MSTTHPPPTTTHETKVAEADYTSCSQSELIARIAHLESQLRDQTARLVNFTLSGHSSSTAATATARPNGSVVRAHRAQREQQRRSRSRSRTPSPRRARPFDPSAYSTRHIALKFAYLGHRYNGFEHANGNVTPAPTIEEVLWKALRKARLISPPLSDGADTSVDVVWDEKERIARYTRGDDPLDYEEGKVRLELNWDGCEYSKCGRTDRGVSAFGQVVGVRVRSNRPLEKEEVVQAEEHDCARNKDADEDDQEQEQGVGERTEEGEEDMFGMMVGDPGSESDTESKISKQSFHPVKDELSYISILNAILPPDIRVLAWCPDPPATFDARFSCRERRYKYFFTNPSFCPTPGALGLKNGMREGYLDIDKMRVAAKKLEGLHDFRNLCKIDASKQMASCERRVTFADVVRFEDEGGVSARSEMSQFGIGSPAPPPTTALKAGPEVYTFCVHGTAFLWHQVRCMVAILFLVGQGLEQPSVVDELLDIEKNPGRPMYEMADDAPLVLWDCVFPPDDNGDKEMVDSLNWLYAGDEATLPSLTTKGDGKFGAGGVVDELWTVWREAKMKEILAGSLLNLAIGQGDGSSLRRGARKDVNHPPGRSQKVFQGGDNARIAGKYVPVMQKPKMDSLQVLNGKFASGKKVRRDARNGEAGGV
ncbi:tRNA pseudouridine(38-40) synthase [Exophiala spinifera]|uniref:tRNA pseudouridine(38-40) synthase n=1 Tax=Exophiala spinifera TaxID=91928 RepID=A0A0D2BG92_9EURO|nr:tRNA pseudouridine(38-40) synthase [Exophiala spinifera]KIW10379.1 tRNA pseudouridine(38-40) synthase [Exophiala spinifera]